MYTIHTLHCANANLAKIREDLIERFISNISNLDGNQDVMQILVQHMLDENSASPPRLINLSTCIIQCSYRALCHGILPQAFLELVNNDSLSTHRIVSKITLQHLQTLHLLWISRHDLVHTSMSGREQIEKLLLL